MNDKNPFKFRIGYWKSEYEPHLPSVEIFVDSTWDHEEKVKIFNYLTNGKVKDMWKGPSFCRICNCLNGTTCLSDGVYTWPQGYAHYIANHNVKPPQHFIDHVNSVITKSGN
jgi:hypothetical protein